MRLKNNPAKTIEGVFPAIITPNAGFKKSIKLNIPSCDNTFNKIKNSQTIPVLIKLSFTIKYVVDATRYPQPIIPRIPHQPVCNQVVSSRVPPLKIAINISSPTKPAPFKITT